jgi:hypothetical protein
MAKSALNLGEQFAVEYLAGHALRAERFTKAEMRQGKTPDFRIFKGSEFVFYCESKHVQYDDWLDKQLENAKPLEIVGGLRHDPIFNRLADRIHDAAKQFDAVNHDHEFPNVLIFTNSDTHCGFPDLLSVLTGNFHAEGGAVEPIYKEISEGRIREEKLTIDLYVWLNEWKGKQQKGTLYFNAGSKHYGAVSALFGSDPSKHRRVG